MLDSIDNLLIRACKSYEPYKRIYSVYNRFYGLQSFKKLSQEIGENKAKQQIDMALAQILTSLIKINNIKVDQFDYINLALNMNPERDKYEQVVEFLIFRIRIAKTTELDGFISPTRHTRKKEVLNSL